MSTVMKKGLGSIVPPPAKESRDDKQLRHDRWTAFFVVAVMAALFALIIWLASLGGGIQYDGMDYWDMMP